MQENIRLKEAIKILKKAGKIKGQDDIATDLGYKRAQTISDFVKGRSEFNGRALNSFLLCYGISKEWWDSGTGVVFLPENESSKNDDSKENLKTKSPAEAGDKKEEVLPDPAAPGIYQDIVQALIRNSDAMAKALVKMGDLSDALLEERQYIRSTAAAVADIAQKLNKRTSLDELKAQMDLNFQHDEQVDLFLAQRVAALESRPVEELLDDMHNAMLGDPTGQKKHKTAGQHS